MSAAILHNPTDPNGLHLRRNHWGWAVYEGQEQLTNPTDRQDTAERHLDEIERARRTKRRNCMCCQTHFLSEGPHNRLCPDCRRLSSYDGHA